MKLLSDKLLVATSMAYYFWFKESVLKKFSLCSDFTEDGTKATFPQVSEESDSGLKGEFRAFSCL